MACILKMLWFSVGGSKFSMINMKLHGIQIVKQSSSILLLGAYALVGSAYNSIVHFSIKLYYSEGT